MQELNENIQREIMEFLPPVSLRKVMMTDSDMLNCYTAGEFTRRSSAMIYKELEVLSIFIPHEMSLKTHVPNSHYFRYMGRGIEVIEVMMQDLEFIIHVQYSGVRPAGLLYFEGLGRRVIIDILQKYVEQMRTTIIKKNLMRTSILSRKKHW